MLNMRPTMMHTSAVHAGLMLTCALFGASSLRAQQPPRLAAPSIPIEKYTLPNGLQVILHVDRTLPVVNINQWFNVGSANEQAGRSGFAHLFEHMMFQGSVNAPGEYFVKVEAAGAKLLDDAGQGRGANGTTNQDRTNYFATVPSSNLEYLLWLEADRLATLPEALTQATFDNQLAVVANERRESYETRPYGRALTIILKHLHQLGHPYHTDVIGLQEDLAKSSLDDVKRFFRTYYTPNNLSLVVAGDFEPAEAKRLVEKYFGSIPPGPALVRPAKALDRLTSEIVVEVDDRVALERTYLAWHSPAFFDPGDAELDLATSILTDGLSSRLNQALVQRERLATAVTAVQSSRRLSGYFLVTATARVGTTLERVEQVVSEEIARLASEGPTAEELSRAKAKWEFAYLSSLEMLGGRGGKADALNQYNTFLGDPGKFDADLERYRGATVDAVRAAVDTHLDNRQRVLVRFRSQKARASTAAALDRSRPPALGVDRPFVAPSVGSARLENGLEVLVVNKPELAKVAVTLSTRAGSVTDPAGKSGLAAMTNRVMQRGTTTRDAIAIDRALGSLGTRIVVPGVRVVEGAGFSMEVLKRNLTPALALMADVVMRPVFAAEELQRERQQTLDLFAQQAVDGNSVAFRASSLLPYGPGHPYALPSRGIASTVQALQRDDLVAFHRRYWKPGSSAVVFVGDITLNEAVSLTRQQFGAWSGGAAPAVMVPPAQPLGLGKIFLIDQPGAAQTVVTHVFHAPERTSRDYDALSLLNSLYGGSFGTRLNLNLREDKGYSYGVYAELENFAHGGAWYVFGSVQTDKTRESVIEFFREMKGIAGERPVTNEEFSAGKLSRVRGYAQQFEGYGRVERQVSGLWVAGLPMSALQTESQSIDRLTLANVNAVAAKYAAPQKTSLLLVGDLSKIEAGIRSLGLGEVVILDRDGRPKSVP